MGGGARLEVHNKPMLPADAHPSVVHVAKQTAAKYKAEKAVPRLQPAGGALSEMVHAQLGQAWVEDGKVSACMACSTAFSSTLRRHHCRLLGIVVCEACSFKRVTLPGQGSGGVRVCDAAFSITRHLGRLADAQDAAAAQGRAAAPPEAATAAQKAGIAAATRQELLGGGEGGAAVAGGERSRGQAKQASAGVSAAHEAMNALHERGEKLGTLNDRAAQMGNEAEDFHAMAKKLRQQAEKQARWLPF